MIRIGDGADRDRSAAPDMDVSSAIESPQMKGRHIPTMVLRSLAL
jgi:hypothetical protein